MRIVIWISRWLWSSCLDGGVNVFHVAVENWFWFRRRVPQYAFTPYFENKVLAERPYLTRQMCICVIEAPIHVEPQDADDRYRFWGRIEELGGRYLRVVTLSDKLIIHNAFLDRRFRP